MIKLSHINYKTKGIDVITDFNLSIPSNKTTCILGNKNSGKTTLMKILAKLNNEYTGVVSLDGKNIKNENIKISFVSSEMEDNVNLNIYEYLVFYMKINRIDNGFNYEIDNLLNKSQMQIYKYTDWSLLSFEEKKIISIIRAIIVKPDIIFIDSIFAGLSEDNIKKIKKLISLVSNTTTIIMAERDFSHLNDIVDYIVAIKDNRIIIEGYLKDILNKLTTGNTIEIQVIGDVDKTIRLLSMNKLVNNISSDNNRVLFEYEGDEIDSNKILKDLIENDIKVVSYKKDNSKYNNILNLINDANLGYTISKEVF